MKNLLLTLGHNSSAILIEDNRVVWGYETERVTGVKSDSRFPQPVLDFANCPKPDMVYVSHWAPNGDVNAMSHKHWQPEAFDGVPIRSVNTEFTHHDAHIAAARCYAGAAFQRNVRPIGVVIDGFGTAGEHFSVYDLSNGGCRLLERVHGYNTSLGLWYQYATAFLGMKMHEDEYKMLGYEAHIHPVRGREIDTFTEAIAVDWVAQMNASIYRSPYDPLYNIEALAEVKQKVFDHLTYVARSLDISNIASDSGRVQIAYHVQRLLERVVALKLEKYKPTSLLLSGGVFYNVKLNMVLINHFQCPTCVYPLAGDQGCAIGLYHRDHPEFQFPTDLYWGKRVLKDVGQVPGLAYVSDELEAIRQVHARLKSHGIVNFVRGYMEFGPRALCNTSTLALPTRENVAKINAANERNTIMPMAPVMTVQQYRERFEDHQHVWQSHQHMIVALEYNEHPLDNELGVAHEYAWPYKHHTGRPQAISPHDPLNVLLNATGPLINTSFNFHGMPIALGMPSVVDNHMMQYQRDNSFSTVVVTNA